MSNHTKINYLELPARDLAVVKRLYNGAFGWAFTDHGPDYCAFNDGGMDGGIYRANAASTIASGAALVKDIFSFPGGRRFHFLDPNGNGLAVWCRA